MEKMSVSKPVPKKARAEATLTSSSAAMSLKRPQCSSKPEEEEEKDHLTLASPAQTTPMKSQVHPKGHNSVELSEVWKMMDKNPFLRVTDVNKLHDVWFIPISVEITNSSVTTVSILQIVLGPHIKRRTTTTKMNIDDLLRLCYLCDKMQWDMQGFTPVDYDEWLDDKTAVCVKKIGRDDATNRSKLLDFLLNPEHHQHDFTFYPNCLHGNYGIFFRKICYHSYKTGVKEDKLENPSMMKCTAARGKFDYVLEVRLIQLPTGWFTSDDTKIEETEDTTDTQPMDE